MFRHPNPVLEYIRRYGLAACCLIAPVMLASFAFNSAIKWLVPANVPNLEIKYEPASSKKEAQLGTASNAQRNTDTRAAVSRAEADPIILPLSLDIAGRYSYAIASGFVYLVSAAALIYGIAVALQRLTPLQFTALAAPAIITAVIISIYPTPADFARPLIIDKLLNAADGFPELIPLGVHNTGDAVRRLAKFNTAVVLVPIAVMLVALFALSVRPPDGELNMDDLKRRLTAIRWGLGFASALLATSVLATKTLFEWPLKLLHSSQEAALKPIADVLTLGLGAIGTIVLIAAFAPVVAAWTLDVARYRGLQSETLMPAKPRSIAGAKSEPAGRRLEQARALDELVFAPVSALSGIVAVLAPVLASPFVDALKVILGAIPVR